MRLVPFAISTGITALLIFALSHKWGSLPPIGPLLSPQVGFWQNATPISRDYSETLDLPGITGDKVEVWLDDRMVPHIFAENDADAYYAQGYLTARDRLWQMELQIFAASGRLSEILGPKMLEYDRMQRRRGIVYGAEMALKEMVKDSLTKTAITSYAAGVNAWIATLTNASLPLEYKLLDYKPQPWTALNSAILLKMMANDLAGQAEDLEYTNARRLFSKEDFNLLYPDFSDSLDPIVPKHTHFEAATLKATAPPDSLIKLAGALQHFKDEKPDPDNGSNNWAVAGSKTRSGAPILCNDPHLSLSLPSLWYEIQLHTPEMNTYGASLPGAPGVIIGFNENIAWGVTNGEEDVKDYYKMQFRNGRKEYLFNGAYRPADLRVEKISIRGQQPFYDTVAYTVWGPLAYDNTFPEHQKQEFQFLAMRWKAHDPSNELRTFLLLNRAKNYQDYLAAIRDFQCPAQNFAFASRDGDIAIWHNGKYPLRWKDQGKFIMPGSDSSFAWQGYIPQEELPHLYNPVRGFVSSANQNPTDSTYPYNFVGGYDLFRGKRINDVLAGDSDITVQDMMNLQNDYTNLLARAAVPVFNAHLKGKLTADQERYWKTVTGWNQQSTPESKAATVFQLVWNNLQELIWNDEMAQFGEDVYQMPWEKTTLNLLIKDTAFKFIDNINTPEKETFSGLMHAALAKAVDTAKVLDAKDKLEWGRYRGTDIRHITRSIVPFGVYHLYTGGGRHIVNCIKDTHGPSWRMVVQMSDPIEAYGVYPGGESGNPGSPYYDNGVQDWVNGNYNQLHLFKADEGDDPDVKYKMILK
jgi:penicillin amidase